VGQIIAMGGGGFSMEPDNLALDQYILQQVNVPHPRICFLSQASGEARDYILNFHTAFNRLGALPSHLLLWPYPPQAMSDLLLNQDVIYVGGGNTKSMLALWREWGIDSILRQAYEQGVVLSGISAGAICWFEEGLTDSIPGQMTALPCLGLVKGSCTPHYDGEAARRPALLEMIGNGSLRSGYAFDDGAAGHFVDGVLKQCVSSRTTAHGYRIERRGDAAMETRLSTQFVG
jgi:dipeptidase E